MSRFSLPVVAKSGRFFAVLFAVALAASACSGSSDVELDDASAATEATEATDDGDTAPSEDTDVSGDATADAEDEAMGEDEASVDGAVETTTPGDVDGDSTGGSSANAELGSAELTAALEAGTGDRFSLPFMYLTVDQDCSGCAETMSLYYVPSEAKASILTLATAYIDGVAQSDFSAVDPSLQAGDPRRIAEQLAGTDADFSVDGVSGAITRWTLDGNTVTLRCLQVDTRPIDMRTEVCENSIIG